MSTGERKGPAFENEVAQLLRLRGYQVSQNEIVAGTQIDIVARRRDPLDNLCLLVECGDRDSAIGVDLIKEKAAVLLASDSRHEMRRLVYVARRGFTADAKTYAASQPTITLMTIAELEQQLVDFTPYIDSYCTKFESSEGFLREGALYRAYVDPAVRNEQGKLLPSLLQAATEWLDDQQHQLLILLGEYGSGKTSFSRHLTYQMLKSYQSGSPGARLPVLINLREYRRSFSIQQVVTDVLVNQFGVNLGSFAAFERMCSTGRVVLVLDGFDEMVSSVDDRIVFDAFAQVLVLAALNVKTVLTCRTNMFASHRSFIRMLQKSSVTTANSALGRVLVSDLDRFATILELLAWDDARIEQYVTNRAGDDAPDILSAIRSVHDLSDLSSRPVLLDMVVKTIPKLQTSATPINSAALYDAYTTMWTARDEWRVKTDATTRRTVCEALAVSMHRAGISAITHQRLHSIVAGACASASGDVTATVAEFEADIQICSFLVRSTDGDFRFAHKSFAEYFIAVRAVDELLEGPRDDHDDDDQLRLRGNLVLGGGTDFHSLILAYWYDVFDSRDLAPQPQSRLHGFSREWPTIWPHVLPVSAPEYATRRARDLRSAIELQVLRDFPTAAAAPGATIVSSPEIATFALEYLVVRGVAASDAIKATETNGSALLVDMLRQAQPNDFVRNGVTALREAMVSTADSALAAGVASALARSGHLSAADLVTLRQKLDQPLWQYCLFEVAASSATSFDLSELVTTLADASLIERVIGVWSALEKGTSTVAVEVAIRSVLDEALAAPNAADQELAIQLVAGLSFGSDREALNFYQEIQRRDLSERSRLTALAALDTLSDAASVKAVRALRAQEPSQRIRSRLQALEQRLADLHKPRQSKDRRRVGNASMRDALWVRLRPR